MRRKLIFVLVVGLAGITAFVAVRAYIIVGKEHVQFAPDQTSYQDDEGRTIPVEGWRKKSGEFRFFSK